MIGKIITTYRPDDVTDPDVVGFSDRIEEFGKITNENTLTWKGMLNAHRVRRKFFQQYGAKATDHALTNFETIDLNENDCQNLLDKALSNNLNKQESGFFKGQILTEMAGLSSEDGMTMQIHTGSYRNHDDKLALERGPDMGSDIPIISEFTKKFKETIKSSWTQSKIKNNTFYLR